MKTKLFKLTHFPWYPFLFSMFPVLNLLQTNLGQVNWLAGMRPLVGVIALTMVVLLVLRLALGNIHRAAFLTTLWLLLFFSYGHIYIFLQEEKETPDPNLTLLLATTCLFLALLAFWWARRPRLQFGNSAGALNIIALGFVLVTTGQIFYGSNIAKQDANLNPTTALTIPADQSLPDIYYIIVDSYGRSDLLASAYHFDNSDFIEYLQDLGFYVARCSQGNYVRTEVSLASSFNMDYLQNMDEAFTDTESTDRRKLWEVLKHSRIRQTLESAGYKTVAFATGFSWSEVDDADVFLSPSPLWSGLTEFEILLLETTPARHLEDLEIINLKQLEGKRFRERTLHIFDKMQELARMPGPKFVFVHIIPPHPPFVFGPNGEELNPRDFLNEQNQYPAKEYAEGYVFQATYINTQLESAVATLINESATPPVIVIQGDHGPWIQPDNKRFWILNAYYLPGHQDALYPKISPVNTFRVILNAYLGGSYNLLEDISYFSPAKRPYDLKPILNSCTGQ